MTYSELGELIGVPAFFLGQTLDVLRDKILPAHNLPRIDALVVSKESGEAGDSFFAGGKGDLTPEEYRELLDSEREKVFAYSRWDEIVPRLQIHYGGDEYAALKRRQRR